MSASAAAARGVVPLTLGWAAALSLSELGVVVLALAAVALDVVDDNYPRPQPGTSAGIDARAGRVRAARRRLLRPRTSRSREPINER